jgi:hypothetical protein
MIPKSTTTRAREIHGLSVILDFHGGGKPYQDKSFFKNLNSTELVYAQFL